MELIAKLEIGRALDAHLLPRRNERLSGREERTIPPGVLRPADLVSCQIDARRLEVGVPIEPEMTSETGYEGVGVTTVRLTVTRHRDDSVTASCT